MERIAGAPDHGIDPAALLRASEEATIAAGLSTSAPARARREAERLLTAAYLRWANALSMAGRPRLAVAEAAALPQPAHPAPSLEAVAGAPDFAAHLHGLEQRHPFYNRLQAELAQARRAGAGPERERLLLANLQRARLLPSSGRHIVVDTAGQRLWMFEDGRVAGRMRVVVGTPAMETPDMASFVDEAIARPFWNVPEDLARDRVAPRVLLEGPRHLQRERLQVLSGWTADARPIPATAVDWKAAAAGRQSVRLRQEPGPWNMMGEMKFMVRNELGIFLHDTPDRRLFRVANRAQSAGCVRLEDWERLALWLFDGRLPQMRGTAEERLPLAQPVPIYMLHFTADPSRPGAPGVPDRYGRDTAAGRA